MFVMFIARGVYRYYLYGDKFGVRAFYRCSKTGKSGSIHNDTLYTYLIKFLTHEIYTRICLKISKLF